MLIFGLLMPMAKEILKEQKGRNEVYVKARIKIIYLDLINSVRFSYRHNFCLMKVPVKC